MRCRRWVGHLLTAASVLGMGRTTAYELALGGTVADPGAAGGRADQGRRPLRCWRCSSCPPPSLRRFPRRAWAGMKDPTEQGVCGEGLHVQALRLPGRVRPARSDGQNEATTTPRPEGEPVVLTTTMPLRAPEMVEPDLVTLEVTRTPM